MIHQLVKSYLLKHSKVSIQGMGEWKVSYVPSHIHPVLQTFTIPGNYVCFTYNERAVTTPELIAEAAHTWQVSAEVAEAKVNAWVQEVKDTLNLHAVYEWGSMGRMVKNSIGKPEFEPAMDSDFSPESFGLENFEIANIHIKHTAEAVANATTAAAEEKTPNADVAKEEYTPTIEEQPAVAAAATDSQVAADVQDALQEEEKEEEAVSTSSHKLTFLLVILAILLLLVVAMGVLYIKSPQTIGVYKHKAGLWLEKVPFIHYQSHRDTVPSIFYEETNEGEVADGDENAPDKLIFDDNFIANTTEYISSEDEGEYIEYVETTEPSEPEVKVASVAQKHVAKTTTKQVETVKQAATPAKAISTKQVTATSQVAKETGSTPARSKAVATSTTHTEVVKPATTAISQPVSGTYYIILGSFQSEANAEAYVEDMNNRYGNAHNLGKGKSSGLYMIGIGPYTQEEAVQKIANEGIKGWILKK